MKSYFSNLVKKTGIKVSGGNEDKNKSSTTIPGSSEVISENTSHAIVAEGEQTRAIETSNPMISNEPATEEVEGQQSIHIVKSSSFDLPNLLGDQQPQPDSKSKSHRSVNDLDHAANLTEDLPLKTVITNHSEAHAAKGIHENDSISNYKQFELAEEEQQQQVHTNSDERPSTDENLKEIEYSLTHNVQDKKPSDLRVNTGLQKNNNNKQHFLTEIQEWISQDATKSYSHMLKDPADKDSVHDKSVSAIEDDNNIISPRDNFADRQVPFTHLHYPQYPRSSPSSLQPLEDDNESEISNCVISIGSINIDINESTSPVAKNQSEFKWSKSIASHDGNTGNNSERSSGTNITRLSRNYLRFG